MKKFLSVLALIVLVGSDVLTSISYAIEEIVDNTEVVQNEMGEVGENKDEENLDQSDEILDEELINHSEENYEGEEPDEEKFEETENMENPEEISQENEEILQELLGENIDDEVIDDKMEDTEEEGKSEIEIARETLNENVIEKLEKYNEVVVNVSAKEGTFPEGRYVNIEAVKGNLTQYTLTLDPGEGSIVSGENITINEETGTGTILSEDGNVTLPLAVRENHEFLGWYTAGESFAGSGGNSYEITGDITLYAKWEEGEGVTYTVTFDANRGTFANLPDPQTVASGSLISTPDQQHIPELPGYNFDGWWTEPRGGTQWDFANDVVTGNITLYAHWTYDLENGDLDVYILDANGDISTYVMMDRNVGASEIYNQDFSQQNTGSFGFIYQWGNNWGFERCRGNGTTCHGTGTSNPDTSTSQVDKSIWSNYYNSKYASKTWIAVDKNTPWQKNPDVKDNLWGGESDEVSDKQGPCPDGYYVPLKAEFNDIILKWNTLKGYNITANNGFSDVEIEDFTHDFLWPLAGAHRKGEITDSEQGGCAEYWTSVTSDTKNAKNIFFCKVGANTWFDGDGKRKYDSTGGATRNNGSTVRCFKNTNTSNLVIDPDGGKGAVISVDKVNGVNTIVALTEPSRTQAGVGALIFSGWYTSPTFESNTKKEARDPVNPQADPTVYTLSANETGLYAKWSCPSGHTYDGVDCASAYNITFDANEGFFDVGGESKDTKTELLDYGAIYNYSDLPTPTRSGHVFKGWYTNFDGVDDYVDYGIGFKFSDKISIHVSAYMEDWTEFADGNSGKRIISCLNGPNTAEGWAIKGKEKTKIQFACVDSSNWKSATSDKLWSSLAPGWHDFDVVFDGQNARLYLDGDSTALATSEDFTGGKLTYNSTNSILLGAQPGTSNAPYSNDPAYFHGKIKDVIIQNSDQRITSTDVLLVPHQDVTYYALWEEIDGYTVTFDSMGGSDVPSQTVKSGTTGVRPSDPTKTGYIFSGWFLDGATEEFYFTGTQITGNITLYAHWNTGVSEFTVNCYKKVLDVDHNVLENDSYSYLTGIVITGATADEITVADYAYKCVTDATEGYEYTGAIVYSSEDESGTKKETATILPDGSMKIDMFFQPVQNQFTLNQATHTSTAGSSQNGLYYYGAKVTLNGDSNDDCFEWDEWNGFPEGFENSKQTYFYMPNRAVSVTPSVTQNTYNIIFSGNGSTSGEMSPMNGLDCSESKPLTINNFEKSGYSFSGWSETENGAKKYENNESVSRLSTIDKDDVFLYAVWDVDQYDVNVSVETGQENMGYLSGNTSTGVSLTGLYEYGKNLVFIAVPELGYLFDYWEVNGSTKLPEGATTGENQLTIVVNQILDIVAHFTANEKNVTINYYEMNTGGLYPNEPYYMDSLTGLVGQTKSIDPESRIGFHLDNNRSNTGVTISENSEDNVINIYYERERYFIERSGRYYQMPDATYIDFVKITPDNQPHYQYYYGEEIEIEYLNPEGWNFSGWYDATSEGKGFPSDEVSLDSQNITFHMPNHDVWVEPIMEHIPYTLSFTGYEGAEVTNFDYCSYGTGDRETYYDYSECLPYLNKEGYLFNGWDDENGSWVRRYNEYSPDPILNRMPAHDYKLVANFEPRNNMSYEKYYYFQDIEGTGYTLSGDLTDLGNNDGVTDQKMPGREPLYNIDGFQYSGFGYSGVMLPRDQWPIIKPIGDNYINYYYDRKVYLVDVNYDNKIMSITGAGEYRYEAPVNLVATVNTGYQFSGFSSYQGELLSSGSVYNFTMPDSFVDIYADANPIEYSIEYEPNGGELDPYSSYVNYTVESSDLSIGNPYKDGYKFLGWTGGVVSGGIEGEEDIVEPTRDLIIAGGSIGDRKYYANWEPDEVKVTVNYYLKKIDSENNTLIDGVDIYLAGVEYTGLSDDIVNIFSRYGTGIEGYHYDHAAVFSGGERTGATETTVLPDGSREINMYYIPNKYNFTLNSDLYSSTEGSSEITGYYYGAAVRLSGGSNNDCFTWSGWATSGIILSDNTVKQTLFTMPANDVEVTPSTTEKTYNIIFNGNGSTLGEMSPMNGVRCTESIGLTLNSFGKKGYTFTGWSRTSGDNIREYKDGQVVTGLSMNDGENVNLYVVWDIDWYTVTFDLNGGSLTGDMTLTTGYTIETPAISLENFIPVKSGYTLIGWYRDDTLVDHIAGGEIGDYILIAHWKADSDTLYTVKYYKQNLNGGYDVWTGIYTGETDIEVTALVKDFTGFTYSGGNENNVTTGVVIGDGSLVLKLFYDRNKYTIIWKDGNGETLKSENLFYETIPEYIGNTPTKTKTAQYTYTFNGTWLPNIESVTTGATYLAQFDEILNSYTINIVPNDTDMGTISTGEIDVSYGAVIVESGNIITIGGIEIEAIPNHADAQYTYEFDNWTNTCGSELVGTCTIQANFKKTLNKYPITWKNDDGSLIDTTMVEYGATPTHANPTKSETEDYRYVFIGWTPEVVAVVGYAEYTAVFNAEEKKTPTGGGGGMSGGGGRGGNIDNSDNQHGSAEENIDGDEYTGDEVVDDINKNIVPLYKWTYENNVTTMDTLENADPDGLLTRGHLAKMVVNYMVNVLGRSMPYDVTYNCLYWGDNESSWESDEIRDYATKACAFGVMGINMEDNKFLPNSVVTRAEFGTVMSRVLWGDKYNITDTDHRSYYENHLQALKKDSILTQIANPETRWEIRKWVWLVFRRIVEKYKK